MSPVLELFRSFVSQVADAGVADVVVDAGQALAAAAPPPSSEVSGEADTVKGILVSLGFEPVLAGQAAVSVPIVRYVAMPLAKSWQKIPTHLKKAAATGLTCILNAGLAWATGTAAPIPAASAGAVGALAAMWFFDFMHKRTKVDGAG